MMGLAQMPLRVEIFAGHYGNAAFSTNVLKDCIRVSQDSGRVIRNLVTGVSSLLRDRSHAKAPKRRKA